MPQPSVCIIIPFFEQAAFLRETVESALRQTYKSFEIVIVDDASATCSAAEILSGYNQASLRIIRHERNLGIGATRNTAARSSRSHYILPLDSDDLIEPDYLEKTIATIEKTNADGVYTNIRVFGEKEFDYMPEVSMIKVLAGTMLPSTFLYTRKMFDALGGYKITLPYGEDRDFWIRSLKFGCKFEHVCAPLFLYRKHKSGMSKRDPGKRFLMHFREHRELYLSHLEEILSLREENQFERINKLEKMEIEYYALKRSYDAILQKEKTQSARNKLKSQQSALKSITDWFTGADSRV